ncbi:hypothetical protein Q9233_012988 [Columba guinea]|nr:hypothetical protein Q9233_012988 [Columba guinea]
MASPDEQGAAGPQAVGGLLPEVWAELFQNQEHLFDRVLPWLRQQLEAIYGSQWWLARSAESTILHALCICGLDGDAMVQMMQDYLEEHTEELVHGVISIIGLDLSLYITQVLTFQLRRKPELAKALMATRICEFHLY